MNPILEIVTVALLVICFLGMIASIYILIRNEAVCKFRLKIIDLCKEYSLRNRDINGFAIFRNIPSYNDMLYSFKSLKPENWIKAEDLIKLYSN